MEEYQVYGLCGEGNFGRVVKARRKGTGELAALKMIPTAGKSAKQLAELEHEISILSALRHPNIVQMHRWFCTDREIVVETELCEGQLFEILQDDGSLPEPEVRQIARQLVAALQYLHARNIVHRDIKPQNVLIGAGGTVKVADFGFARQARESMVMNSIKGTPLYMAPEVVQEKPYNHTADLWSLGVILFELYVGRPPFYTDNIYKLLRLIVKEPVVFPGDIPTDLHRLLDGLLQKDPAHRCSWPALGRHPFLQLDELAPAAGRGRPKTAATEARPEPVEKPESARPASARAAGGRFGAAELAALQQQLDAIGGAGRSAELSARLPERLRELRSWAESGRASHQVDRQLCGSLLRAATVSVHHDTAVLMLDAAAVYVQGRGLDPMGILESCGDWIVQACSGPQTRSPAARLVSLLVLSGEAPREKLVPAMLAHSSIMLRALVLTACSQTDPSSKSCDGPWISVRALCRLMSLEHLPREPFPSEAPHGSRRVAGLIASPVTEAAAIMSESSQHITALAVQLKHCEAPHGDILEVIAHTTAATTELAGMLSCSTPALQAILSVPGQLAPCQLLVLSHLTAAAIPKPVLAQLVELASSSFRAPACCSTASALLASLMNHESAQLLMKDFVGQPDTHKRLAGALMAPAQPQSILTQLGVSVRDSNIAGLQHAWIARRGPKDGLVRLALALLPGLSPQQTNNTLEANHQLLLTDAASSLSPSGQLTLASLIYDMASACPQFARTQLVEHKTVSALSAALEPESLAQLAAWPAAEAGGIQAAASLVRLLVSTLYLPFIDPNTDLANLSRSIAKSRLVESLVACLDLLALDGVAPPLGLLLRVVLLPDLAHMKKIVECALLRHRVVAALVTQALNPHDDSSGAAESAIGDLLSIVSHLARAGGQNYYSVILESEVILTLAPLIRVSLPELRAKMGNLIGNLCRHDGTFYPVLLHHQWLLPELCLRLRDFDCSVRKFASFALGNAAYHSNALYELLGPAIPSLVALTSDDDSRTQANAAGALGNLCRNSSQLVDLLLSTGAPAALLRLVQSGVEKHPRRIALFALGNICQFDEGKKMLVALGFREAMEFFSKEFPEEPTIQKVVVKIEKLLCPPL